MGEERLSSSGRAIDNWLHEVSVMKRIAFQKGERADMLAWI
jgi:hypothetical protein